VYASRTARCQHPPAAVTLESLRSPPSAAGWRAVHCWSLCIRTRGAHSFVMRRRCRPLWAGRAVPSCCPQLVLAAAQCRLISRAGRQPRSVAAMGAGCVHCSRSRHVAVRYSREPHLSPQPHDCRRRRCASRPLQPRRRFSSRWAGHPPLARPLTSARCSNSGGPPESALCSRLWRSASRRCCATRGRCYPNVARTRRRPLGLVTRSTPASPMLLGQPPLARSPALMRSPPSLLECDSPSPLGSLPQPHD
jgi:hypothetical protein